jgi:glutamate N-acetyltransferase/amino-acid N-acetyltransferase
VSVTAPAGFVAAGAAVGIKPTGHPDLALVATASGRAVEAAAVFTANRSAAAPVEISRAHLETTGGRAAGVLLTSGNANAATGDAGRAAAAELCALAASGIGVPTEEVLICQTGLIGVPFPIATVRPAVGGVVRTLAGGADAARAAATAIMTTDTARKEVLVDGGGFLVGGMAKGAAMLAPDMATMLAVLTTDAGCEAGLLRRLLAEAVGETFNRLSVDGCTSTNDTVIVLASGARPAVPPAALGRSLAEACRSLAEQMAEDAEGATKVVRFGVVGARSDDEAHRAARKVADSLLVKCSLNGEDPYWGRVVSEVASAGVGFELDRVAVAYGGVEVCGHGEAVEHDEAAVARHLAGRHLELTVDLGLGTGRAVVLGTDLGYGYIDENRTTS